MYFLTIAGVINVILNLVFVIKFRMDVAGVATATVIAQVISAALVVICLMRESGPLRLDLRRLHIDRDILLKIIRIGLPAKLADLVVSSLFDTLGKVSRSKAPCNAAYFYNRVNYGTYEEHTRKEYQQHNGGDDTGDNKDHHPDLTVHAPH